MSGFEIATIVLGVSFVLMIAWLWTDYDTSVKIMSAMTEELRKTQRRFEQHEYKQKELADTDMVLDKEINHLRNGVTQSQSDMFEAIHNLQKRVYGLENPPRPSDMSLSEAAEYMKRDLDKHRVRGPAGQVLSGKLFMQRKAFSASELHGRWTKVEDVDRFVRVGLEFSDDGKKWKPAHPMKDC